MAQVGIRSPMGRGVRDWTLARGVTIVEPANLYECTLGDGVFVIFEGNPFLPEDAQTVDVILGVADQLCGAVANPIIRVNESGSSLVVCIHRTNHGVVEGESEPLCVSSSERARLFEPDRDSSRQN